MTAFELTLLRGGRIERRRVEAADAGEARRTAEAGGAAVLSLRPLRGGRMRGPGARKPAFDLWLFCRELAALLEAGLTSAEALAVLADQSGRAEQRALTAALLAELDRGQSLSAALAGQPDRFPPLLVAVVAASEQTGQLAGALRRFLDYRQRVTALKKQLIGALLYPAIVLTVGLAVIVFMLFYVIPVFAALLSTMRPPLPLATRLMLGWSRLLSSHPLAVTLLPAGALLATAGSLAQPRGRAGWVDLLCRIRLIRHYRTLFELTRFYSALGLVLDGGVALPEALRLAGTLLGERRRLQLVRVQAELDAGVPLSTALSRHDLTTPVAAHLLQVGEHTGAIGTMCEHTVRFHDEALARAHDLAARVLGPAIMLAVGVLVGLLVVLLYLPVFELAGGLES